MQAHPQHSNSGQALIEFIVGLVGILVVFAGLLMIGKIGREHTQTMLDARRRAGDFAMSADYTPLSPAPLYIQDWAEGNDEARYSQDDAPIGGDARAVPNQVAVHGRPQDLEVWVGDNDLSGLYRGDGALGSFGFVHGRASSGPIPLYSIIRNLVYDADSIEVESDVYLIWTRGLY